MLVEMPIKKRPDGRAEREEIARCAILARSQAAGVANSAIPFTMQSSFKILEFLMICRIK
jgi:hypothetical protein